MNADRPTRFAFVGYRMHLAMNLLIADPLHESDGREPRAARHGRPVHLRRADHGPNCLLQFILCFQCRYARPRAGGPPNDPSMPPRIYERPPPQDPHRSVDAKQSVFAPDFIERWQNIAKETER